MNTKPQIPARTKRLGPKWTRRLAAKLLSSINFSIVFLAKSDKHQATVCYLNMNG